MLSRLVMAVVVGVVTTLACVLVGSLFVAFNVSWAVAVGHFLQTYAGLLGLLAAVWHFFAGNGQWPLVRP